jgi:hypothetical protein
MKAKLALILAVLMIGAVAAPAFADDPVGGFLDQSGQYLSKTGERLMGGLFAVTEGVLKLPVTMADTHYTEWSSKVSPTANEAGAKLQEGGWKVLTAGCPNEQGK